MYIKAEVPTPDGLLELSVYNGYAMVPDKPYIFEVVEDNEIVTRELYTHHDLAMNEFERVIGIEIANAIQNRRDQTINYYGLNSGPEDALTEGAEL